VQGGLSQISAAMAKVACEHGAEIHTSTPVRRILTRGRRAVGVELETGERLDCDDVVINADFGHAIATLFDPSELRHYSVPALRSRRWSCSTFMMYLGLDRVFPDSFHHTIVFSKDYKRNLDDITRRKVTSDDFSVYIRNSVITDPGTAPPGCSALYILVPVPNNESGICWEEEKHRYRERIFKILAERTAYRNLERHIREELVITPQDWEKKRDVFLGATFNMGHNWKQLLFLRPHNRFEEFDHCYLVGGGTHPGSGLPTIFESARISSNLICKSYRIPHPVPKPLDGMEMELA
jgi:phytoene desaturase